jgi:hypothetical protein
MQPRYFYDLVVEVAIVRPGPIQGGMVHPYLNRRQRLESVVIPSEELRPALERTLGVPIFQEQVMQIAMIAACYTGGEADGLRRDMAAWKRKGGLQKHYDKITKGMAAPGLRRSVCGVHLQADPGLQRVRVCGIPRGVVCAAGLRQLLAEVPPPDGVLRGHGERTTAGLLQHQPVAAGCSAQRRDGPAAGRAAQ